MKTNRADGERIYLRGVRPADVNERYVGWLNDPEINKYLELRFGRHDLAGTAAFVASMAEDPDNAFFAIVLKEGDRHVGNIKIGPINRHHLYADVGLVIGERDCWGKGYATEAIGLVTRYAFETLGLRRLEAGAYEDNAGSAKAFLKAGWFEEGREKSKWRVGNKIMDGLRVACLNPRIGREE